ncbi:hypothetical protein PROFUN_14298 [Planoprotostelium fungivorum]|uniref:DH domain-containing protein n=1 Tax=Planoprotostelium fungivorum TaxID=1890364 RepID=A0A2P6N0I3_9EUKA|nr:hypothetical protein PROFUN_14298 [Planoprotostelium fungivorum]
MEGQDPVRNSTSANKEDQPSTPVKQEADSSSSHDELTKTIAEGEPTDAAVSSERSHEEASQDEVTTKDGSAKSVEDRVVRRTRSQTEGSLPKHPLVDPRLISPPSAGSKVGSAGSSPQETRHNEEESPRRSRKKDSSLSLNDKDPDKKKNKLFSLVGTLMKSNTVNSKKGGTVGKKGIPNFSPPTPTENLREHSNSSPVFPVALNTPPTTAITTPSVSQFPSSPGSSSGQNNAAPPESGPRDWAAREFYTSEIAYLKNLDILVFDYLYAINKDHPIITEDEKKVLFTNVKVIRNFSVKLFQELEGRMKTWGPKQLIGDVFLKLYPFFRAYNEYCNKYDVALENYVEFMKRPEFSTFCNNQLAKTPNGLGPDLQSLLITPVQRIPRYALLLKELLAKTPSDHPDHTHLENAYEKIKDITETVNTSIKQNDNSKQYNKIVDSIEGIMPHMLPHRKFISEDSFVFLPNTAVGIQSSPLSVGTIQKTTPMWLVLFNDTIFMASGASQNDRKLEKVFPFSSLWLRDNGQPHYLVESVFQIITPEETFMVQTKDAAHKKQTMDVLMERINSATKGEDQLATKGERNLSYRFSNGDHYSGMWDYGKIQGKGRYAFFSDKVYEGDLTNGLMDGRGKMVYSGHTIYEGQWAGGEQDGEGTLMQPGVQYVGTWRAGKKKKGVISWDGGQKYTGKFKNDRMHGRGILICMNGDIYDGDWAEGKRSGHGKFTSKRGQYDGYWVNDRREGTGSMVWSNGDFYDGEWKADMRHGEGKMVTVDSSYRGGWSQDRKEGKGTFIQKLNSRPQNNDHDHEAWVNKYEGEWKADKVRACGSSISRAQKHNHGVCIRKTEDGEGEFKYDGNWVNDMREGKGTFTDSYGTYTGSWKEDKSQRNGVGYLVSADQQMHVRGTWCDDYHINDEEEVVVSTLRKGKSYKPKKESTLESTTTQNIPELPPPRLYW